ncbi:acyl-CoA N-acyltransferase [Trametopsis cervina]|nr:acyl-CoA N-acyltransferase [Trametopsis cervina]
MTETNLTSGPNFMFDARLLQTNQLKLIPFDPAVHAELYHTSAQAYPEMWSWLPYGPFATLDAFKAWYESYVHQQRDRVLFAVFDTSKGTGTDTIAAVIGLMNASADNLCAELAFVFTLPPFQRTHVTTQAVGLLLTWCFEDLRLRRVQWQANEANERSWRAAEKMGFVKEGVKRWDRALPPGKGGHVAGRRDPKRDWVGRHTVLLAICWDDWENGVQARVLERMKAR